MANIDKIRLSGQTYNIVDSSAVHSLDGYWTSGETQSAITAATSALAETIAEQGYQTSGDVQNAISGKADSSAVTEAIDAATSGKVDVSVYNTYTGNTAIELGKKFEGVEYDTNTKHINFYNNVSATGTVLAYIDATDFIKDGMVSNVEVKEVSGVTSLVISFNTDAGKEDIVIPISDIFDASNYYTKAEINASLSGKQDTLTAGAGIDIDSANTISITGIPLTVDDNVTSGSNNPVKSSGIYNFVTGETSTKQDTLVSGTNIKTVGTNSILGSGNITLMTAHIGTGDDSTTLIFDFA